MPKFNTYSATIENCTEEEAVDYALGMVWGECECLYQTICYAKHIATVEGIEVYYDYGADYYFFCPVEESDDGAEYSGRQDVDSYC